jgi:hypothetical protein
MIERQDCRGYEKEAVEGITISNSDGNLGLKFGKTSDAYQHAIE